MQQIKNTILIVDDSSTNVFLLESLLKNKDYNIISTQSGEKALSIIKNVKVDLILLDIMMPDISGFDIIDVIEKDDELKKIKIIIVTVYDRDDRMIKILENDNIDYIQKPVILNKLLKKIDKILR